MRKIIKQMINNTETATDFQKNLIGWIAISITLIGGLVSMHTRINANELRIHRNEQVIQQLVIDQKKTYDLISQMRVENLQGFHDLKMQLTTKQDKEK